NAAETRFHPVSEPNGLEGAAGAGVYYVEFDSSNWDKPVLISVAARNDQDSQDPRDTTITHSIDKAFTTDTPDIHGLSYKSTPVVGPRIDARVIDDETPGVFQIESGGRTLVTSGSAQNGHGKNDTYTQRLTSAPDDPATSVHVALVTDGQTDIVADAGQGIVYAAIGGARPGRLVTRHNPPPGPPLSLVPQSHPRSVVPDGLGAGR